MKIGETIKTFYHIPSLSESYQKKRRKRERKDQSKRGRLRYSFSYIYFIIFDRASQEAVADWKQKRNFSFSCHFVAFLRDSIHFVFIHNGQGRGQPAARVVVASKKKKNPFLEAAFFPPNDGGPHPRTAHLTNAPEDDRQKCWLINASEVNIKCRRVQSKWALGLRAPCSRDRR